MSEFKGKLHETACKFPMTDIWNDSCAVSELEYALERGAVGATTNPIIVGNVLRQELPMWTDRINELIATMNTATEDEIAWKLIEEMGVRGAKMLQPTFEKFKGKKGRLSMQTNAKFYRSAEKMTEQALYFNSLAPNMQIKMPVSQEALQAFEDVTYGGASINATVCFTVPQAIAVAEAVERGLKRREKEGLPVDTMSPICTIMIGRTDDWMKDYVKLHNVDINPEYLEWAGIAVMKNAYKIFKERGYRCRLLTAAYRNLYHWSEFVGADISMTIPHGWQEKINACDMEVVSRIDDPVDPEIVQTMLDKIPDFGKAYLADGMKPEEFASYGAFVKTLKSFLAGYDSLISLIRDFMIPNVD